MAKGNTGNLLQHFVAVHALRRLNATAHPVAYVDLFAMSPWEPVDRIEAAFGSVIGSLEGRRPELVTSALLAAQQERRSPLTESYPNTLVIARHAGVQVGSVTACEIDESKRNALLQYVKEFHAGVPINLYDDCTHVKLARATGAAFVIADPYQIDSDNTHEGERGYITVERMRYILGRYNLGVLERARDSSASPCVAVLLSYSETPGRAAVTHRRVEEVFGERGWLVTRVVEPTKLRTGEMRDALHQAWWCASSGLAAAPGNLQELWNEWRRADA